MTNGLTVMARETLAELWDLMCDLDRRVAAIDKKIDAGFKADPARQRIARICLAEDGHRDGCCCWQWG